MAAGTPKKRETQFQRAADGFGQRVHSIDEGQWHQPTACSDWDVRTLVNHVAVEQLWVPPLVEGQSVSDVGSSLDGDQLGDDPVAAWDAALKASSASFGAAGALAGTVSLSPATMLSRPFRRSVDLVLRKARRPGIAPHDGLALLERQHIVERLGRLRRTCPAAQRVFACRT